VSTPSDAFFEQNLQPDEEQAEVAEETLVETDAVPPISAETLPPEAQGEANGGPLGCCLGVVVGLFLTFTLITLVSVLIHNGGYLGVATVPTGTIGGIIGGFLGWKIGKAIYHEYDLSPERRKRLERLDRKFRNQR
jgi:hypothetical protein